MASSKGDPDETAKWAFILTFIGVVAYFGVVYVFVLGPEIADPEAGAGAAPAAQAGHHD